MKPPRWALWELQLNYLPRHGLWQHSKSQLYQEWVTRPACLKWHLKPKWAHRGLFTCDIRSKIYAHASEPDGAFVLDNWYSINKLLRNQQGPPPCVLSPLETRARNCPRRQKKEQYRQDWDKWGMRHVKKRATLQLRRETGETQERSMWTRPREALWHQHRAILIKI